MKRLVGSLLFVTALLSACGEDTGGVIEQDDQTTEDEQSTSADFNAADVSFLQMMIPHHEQAIEMADLAPDRAESQEVKDLAAQIKDAQGPEIETMTAWLEDWDQPVEGEMGGMDMGEGAQMDGMEGMEGMLSDEQMASLEAASGAEFDELFLTSMREHHVGAVMMAETELETGESVEAKELAQTIIDSQQAEIEEIDRLLEG